MITLMRASRFRFVLDQIGARVPAGSLDPRDFLLTTADLPGAGWRQLDRRLWRAGKSGGTEWERIARESKSVTGWRSFEQRDAQRWIWAQAREICIFATFLSRGWI